MKETVPLNLTGILPQRVTAHIQGVRTEQLNEAEGNRKNLTNNGKTKKQSPKERKGESLRNNAK